MAEIIEVPLENSATEPENSAPEPENSAPEQETPEPPAVESADVVPVPAPTPPAPKPKARPKGRPKGAPNKPKPKPAPAPPSPAEPELPQYVQEHLPPPPMDLATALLGMIRDGEQRRRDHRVAKYAHWVGNF